MPAQIKDDKLYNTKLRRMWFRRAASLKAAANVAASHGTEMVVMGWNEVKWMAEAMLEIVKRMEPLEAAELEAIEKEAVSASYASRGFEEKE